MSDTTLPVNESGTYDNRILFELGGRMSKDMRFVGLFSIIVGALYCITIFGALIGVPMIFAGLRIRESADAFMGFIHNNDPAALATALERQGRFFFIIKILIIVGICIFILEIIVVILMLIAGALPFTKNYSY